MFSNTYAVSASLRQLLDNVTRLIASTATAGSWTRVLKALLVIDRIVQSKAHLCYFVCNSFSLMRMHECCWAVRCVGRSCHQYDLHIVQHHTYGCVTCLYALTWPSVSQRTQLTIFLHLDWKHSLVSAILQEWWPHCLSCLLQIEPIRLQLCCRRSCTIAFCH